MWWSMADATCAGKPVQAKEVPAETLPEGGFSRRLKRACRARAAVVRFSPAAAGALAGIEAGRSRNNASAGQRQQGRRVLRRGFAPRSDATGQASMGRGRSPQGEPELRVVLQGLRRRDGEACAAAMRSRQAARGRCATRC